MMGYLMQTRWTSLRITFVEHDAKIVTAVSSSGRIDTIYINYGDHIEYGYPNI